MTLFSEEFPANYVDFHSTLRLILRKGGLRAQPLVSEQAFREEG